jgi:hypothetical protein
LSRNPYRSGDFVWSNFPERENPARPGPRHVAYVALSTTTALGGTVLVAFTSSQPWAGPRPPGLYNIDRETAAAMGQSRPFTLDLRRIAPLPVTEDWFPDLNTSDHGILGRAPEGFRVVYEAALTELARRRPENIEHLGPLSPTPRRRP